MMRPQFHFTASQGWINDPHGVTFRNGSYHLFYQHVPASLTWQSNCHWGHATSTNLFEFEHMPVALSPGDGDDGIWSGSIESGIAFYTSVREPQLGAGRIRSATPDDDSWSAWTKDPLILTPPPELDIVAFRDPFVFAHDGGWRMLVGASIAGGTAAALSYRSHDLGTWAYEGIAAQRSTTEIDPVWTGSLWECPQLFELDGRWVMVMSVWESDVLHHVAYAVGDYEGVTFAPTSWGRLSYGPSYYAPSFFRDSDGAPTLLFWFRGVADEAKGWVGAHSLPHSLSLHGDVLVARPHAGLDAYRVDAREGLAADATWRGAGCLTVRSGGSTTATVVVEGTNLVVGVGVEEWQMPYEGGPVRVIVDGPTFELSTRSGVLAAPIRPVGDSVDFTISGEGELTVDGLARPTLA